MKLDLEPETHQMRDLVRDFARSKLNGAADPHPEQFRARWRAAADLGLTGCCAPVEHGGSGMGAADTAGVLEALGEGTGDTGFAFSVAAHLLACVTPLVHFGSEEQKRRWLPGLCSGELIAAHAVTEPEAGSDAMHLRTRAERVGDHYLITGVKAFITNAPVADIFIVQAATEPDGGVFGLTTFLVEAGTPGLGIGRPESKVGLHGSPMAEIHLDGCTVPVDHVLGVPGGGASVFTASMHWERTCLFAVYLGAMKRVIDSTVAYVRQREQFGTPIGAFQAVSHRVVDMLLRYEGARLLLYKAAHDLDQGAVDGVSAALAKIAVSEAAVQVGLDAIQLRGAQGVMHGEAEQMLRDCLPSRIFSGSNEIQRNNVARVLRLDRLERPAHGA
ncbi:acyl-CoA dehydrogenase family protein [Catenulispora sp. NF23]|uniref:Acyl-CoA dehydrogenase family protein n=1 Tax=Catenulispora pinistramenti TaxID=2705254 RepID=A0ABS5KRL3_9ACTN|nr:L-prolyl-[peptidyl-carrier protein] dehydrogenase [Catenulispora pinistramenti]MBS2536878.1 acyl-CoA dehydrogenase family protein [Catenulispora pinistramenti]MBS2548674.1 acyl-CoA dehydrogenase family protein [Catenulispora pinistramenti]